ncbi:hypothetical protein FACS1894167_05370 [Synergistales bacterium]|nr:hypothetical protein FACS1894167_05370 [Synergistales bacterium]
MNEEKSSSLVSVVIPIYNTKPFLTRDLESIVNQTYTNLEIILVDDGSTDGSEKICDEYAASDKRVRVIHKANGGEASARNVGLTHSRGEYVMFCDSDDEIPLDAVMVFSDAFSGSEVDIVIGSYKEIGDEIRYAYASKETYTAAEVAYEMITDKSIYGTQYIMSTVCGKLFKNEIIQKNNISFNENMAVGNDSIFVAEYLRFARKIFNVFVPQYIYYKFNAIPGQRVAGTMWLYPDLYRLVFVTYQKLWELFPNDDVNWAERKKKAAGVIFDKLMPWLINAVTYEEHFPGGLLPNIRELIDSSLMRNASIAYRREWLCNSKIIPLLFRLRMPELLLMALRRRAKERISKKDGQLRVRMIFQDNDN